MLLLYMEQTELLQGACVSSPTPLIMSSSTYTSPVSHKALVLGSHESGDHCCTSLRFPGLPAPTRMAHYTLSTAFKGFSAQNPKFLHILATNQFKWLRATRLGLP